MDTGTGGGSLTFASAADDTTTGSAGDDTTTGSTGSDTTTGSTGSDTTTGGAAGDDTTTGSTAGDDTTTGSTGEGSLALQTALAAVADASAAGELGGFALGDQVRVKRSGECGEVIGLAQFKNADDSAELAYTAADGRAVQGWLYLDQIELVEAQPEA